MAELFTKPLGIFQTCVSASNNLCGKLVSSVSVTFINSSKVTPGNFSS